jgi:Phosphotransferase enzyme family
MPDTTRVPTIEADVLTPVISLSLRRPVPVAGTWAIEPIHGGAGDTLGVYRVAGEVVAEGASMPWSVILKVIGKPARGGDVVDWNYWRREALLYQSDLFAELPQGLERPRCLGVAEHSGDQLWLWLEDIDERHAAWTLDDYGRVAFRVGHFNTAHLCGQPVPEFPWLSRGWLRAKIQDAAGAVASMPSALRHPMVRRALPPDVSAWILQTWADRDHYLRILDRLPHTLCHGDVFRRNALLRQQEDSFALIDWAFVGEGAIGEELVSLIQGSLLFFEIGLESAPELERVVLAGYVDGLRAAGWHGDPELAQLGYAAAATLRYCLGELQTILMVSDDGFHPVVEQIFERAVGDACDGWAAILREHVQPLGARARALAVELGV